MDARPGSGAADEEPLDAAGADEAFAGLTPIDVVDGELMPRASRRRR